MTLSLNILELFKDNNPKVYEKCIKLRKKQTDKSRVFDPLKHWLKNVVWPDESPQSSRDWLGIAYVFFWAYRLRLPTPNLHWADHDGLLRAINEMSMKDLSYLVYALKQHPQTPLYATLKSNFDGIIHRFCCENLIIHLDCQGSDAIALFIVNINHPEDDSGEEDHIHKKTMMVVELVSLLYPEKQRFVCKGIGHKFRFLQVDHDGTKKEIPKENMPHDWLVWVNATFLGLLGIETRPNDWSAYVNQIMYIRKQVISAFEDLLQVLNSYFASNKQKNILKLISNELWDQTNNLLNNVPSLPKCAVDEWGMVREGAANQSSNNQGFLFFDNTNDHKYRSGRSGVESYRAMLIRYIPLQNACRELFRGLANFFNQSKSVMVLSPLIGRKNRRITDEQIAAIKEQTGYTKHRAYLSVNNFSDGLKHLDQFQETFRHLFDQMVNQEELNHLEEKEAEIYQAAWAIWYQFAMQPKWRKHGAIKQAQVITNNALDQVRRSISNGLRKMGITACSLSIINEKLTWEEESALWLVLDVTEPLDLNVAYTLCLVLLNMKIGQHDFKRLARQMVEIHWKNIIVIPRFGGKNFGRRLWRLPSVMLDIKEDCFVENHPWLLIPIEAKSEYFDKLKIEVSKFDIPYAIAKMAQSARELLAHAQHVADLNRLEAELGQDYELDDLGHHVLKEYILKESETISGVFQRYLDVVGHIAETELDIDNIRHDENLMAAAQSIFDLHKKVLPEKDSQGNYFLSHESMAEWADALTEAAELVHQVELLFIASYIEQKSGN